MNRLYRDKCKPPESWADKVAAAFEDYAAFLQKAQLFESLELSCEERRKGFSSYAPEVLKQQGGKPSFPSLWGAAKEILAEMTHGKCSYCEGEINAKRSGQVEHFRPKARFPTLAYDWNNYFLACGGCNGAKSDAWPDAGGYIRPDEGNPEEVFFFSPEGTMAAKGESCDAGQTIRDFDLNRQWLVARRRKHIELVVCVPLKLLLEIYQVNPEVGLARSKEHAARLRDPANAYSAALTQCFVRGWNSAVPGAPL